MFLSTSTNLGLRPLSLAMRSLCLLKIIPCSNQGAHARGTERAFESNIEARERQALFYFITWLFLETFFACQASAVDLQLSPQPDRHLNAHQGRCKNSLVHLAEQPAVTEERIENIN